MLQNLIDERQILLCEDRSTSFRGTARIDIEHFKFDLRPSAESRISSKRHKGASKSNVERLKDIFSNEGCLPFEPENRIVAIISQVVLEQALRLSKKTQDVFLENPCGCPPILQLPPSCRLQCLTGYSRVKAAETFLEPGCRMWAVDLYLEDAGNDLRDVLTDQYSNQRQYSDLDIYYNIRKYHKQGDVYAEGRWRARLSANKQTRLTQFLKHDVLRASLEEVLTMPGQRFGLTLSMCHDIVGMGCDEEFVHYCRRIVTIWSEIFDGNEEFMSQTDRFSVEEVQLRVPGRCLQDFRHLNPLMENGRLFPFIRNPDQRLLVWNRLLKISTLIPSLHSLAQDRKFLYPLAKAIRCLCGGSSKTTLRATLRRTFSPVDQTENAVYIQTTDHASRLCKGTTTQQFNWGIVQLVCFASRKFPDLVRECPLKEPGSAKPLQKEPDGATWASFAQLAHRLGFESEKILELKEKDVDGEIATTMLLLARKPPRFFYDEIEFQQHKLDIVQRFSTARERACVSSSLKWVLEGEGEGLDRRCGRTFEFAHEYNKEHTFLHSFWADKGDSGEGLSPLFIRFAVLKAFFGDLVGEQEAPICLEDISGSSTYVQVGSDLASNVSSRSVVSMGSEHEQAQNEIAQLRAELGQLQVEAEGLREVTKREVAKREEAQKSTAELQERLQQTSIIKGEGERLKQAENKIRELSSQLQQHRRASEAELQQCKRKLDRTETELSEKEAALLQEQERTMAEHDHKARQIEEHHRKELEDLQNLLLEQERSQKSEVDTLKAQLIGEGDALRDAIRVNSQLEDKTKLRNKNYQESLHTLQEALAKTEEKNTVLEAKLQLALRKHTAIEQMVADGGIGHDPRTAPEMTAPDKDIVTGVAINSETTPSRRTATNEQAQTAVPDFAFLHQSEGRVDLSPIPLSASDSVNVSNLKTKVVAGQTEKTWNERWEDVGIAALEQAAQQAYDQTALDKAAGEQAAQQAYDQAALDQATREAQATREEASSLDQAAQPAHYQALDGDVFKRQPPREGQKRSLKEEDEGEVQMDNEIHSPYPSERARRTTPVSGLVRIRFVTKENDTWRGVQTLWVNPSNPSNVSRVAKESLRQGLRLLDTNMQLLAADDCFRAVTADGTNTIILIPQKKLNIDDHLLDSANELTYTTLENHKRLRLREGPVDGRSEKVDARSEKVLRRLRHELDKGRK